MAIIVTGAAGFIGANLVRGLNDAGEDQVIAVDDLTQADKFKNLADCEIKDYLDRSDFLPRFATGDFGKVRAVFHQGACSDTMETDGRYMMQNNYRYSVSLLEGCQAQQIPLLYASSASVYGSGPKFVEDRAAENPLNVYGYSKFLFDQVVRRATNRFRAQVTGFRYFNVYGPRERHKGRMASVAMHNFDELAKDGRVRLFEGWAGYGNGEQKRDFVSVEDVVKVNLHFLEKSVSGIFNLGTGRAQTFNDIACAVVNTVKGTKKSAAELASEKLLEYITFPEALKGKYQSFTQADISKLRAAGYTNDFLTVEEGVGRYVKWLLASG